MNAPQRPSDRLALARIRAGYKDAKDFYSAHGIPQPTYSLHESGGRGLNPRTAKRYADLLGNCTASWLLYGEGKEPASVSEMTRLGLTAAPGYAAEAERKAEEFAAFMLLYDRLHIITRDNIEATKEEFGIVARAFGHDAGERGVIQTAFHLWQNVVRQDDNISLTERVLNELRGFEEALSRVAEAFRGIPKAAPNLPHE